MHLRKKTIMSIIETSSKINKLITYVEAIANLIYNIK